ncbi:MAG: STAS domain-containing protein [Magnetococcales bacterium]|nr:STAS domain-containing protein [Magnetococcales bacterium]
MALSVEANGRQCVIQISGEFNFHMRREFRGAYEKLPPETDFVIDLRRTTGVDSSALGMLLVLREHVTGKGRISIVNAPPKIRELLNVAQFGKIFSVS